MHNSTAPELPAYQNRSTYPEVRYIAQQFVMPRWILSKCAILNQLQCWLCRDDKSKALSRSEIPIGLNASSSPCVSSLGHLADPLPISLPRHLDRPCPRQLPSHHLELYLRRHHVHVKIQSEKREIKLKQHNRIEYWVANTKRSFKHCAILMQKGSVLAVASAIFKCFGWILK